MATGYLPCFGDSDQEDENPDNDSSEYENDNDLSIAPFCHPCGFYDWTIKDIMGEEFTNDCQDLDCTSISQSLKLDLSNYYRMPSPITSLLECLLALDEALLQLMPIESKDFQLHRMKRGRTMTTKLQLYAFIRVKKHTKRHKICTVPSAQFLLGIELEDATYEGSMLHGWFTEEPHFVDLKQPGKVFDRANEPLGQQSIYIPPVDIADLAKNGFLFTGIRDCVKCYSCGRTVENWEVTDNPAERRWHKPNCPFAQGQATDNVPINGSSNQAFAAGFSQNLNRLAMNFNTGLGDRLSRGATPPGHFDVPTAPPITTGQVGAPALNHAPVRQWRMADVISDEHRRYLTSLYLTRELDRLASFCRWPTGRPSVAPAALAEAGFFYLGDIDRTQCFLCGVVLRNWTPEDDAFDEHQSHFPTCPFVLGNDHSNVAVPQMQETQQQLTAAYPCRYPANPHMISETARVESFDRRWPVNHTRALPAEIAEAGFFFSGERDSVKCFYCNGVLQNWAFDDKPWIEHAKWFPNCQFLMRKQGQFFVHRHLSLSPHLPRPILKRQEGATIDPVPPGDLQRVQDLPTIIAGARARRPFPPPMIIDPQEEMHKRRERVDKEMRYNSYVRTAVEMGYDGMAVREVLEKKLEADHAADQNNIFNGLEPLLVAVQAREEEVNRQLEEEHATWMERPIGFREMSTLDTVRFKAFLPGARSDGEDEEDERDIYGSAETPATRNEAISIPGDEESIRAMLQQKKEERLCKICFREQADMLFIPCSHMCCCIECTQAIRQCPICKRRIEKAIRTYLK